MKAMLELNTSALSKHRMAVVMKIRVVDVFLTHEFDHATLFFLFLSIPSLLLVIELF